VRAMVIPRWFVKPQWNPPAMDGGTW